MEKSLVANYTLNKEAPKNERPTKAKRKNKRLKERQKREQRWDFGDDKILFGQKEQELADVAARQYYHDERYNGYD